MGIILHIERNKEMFKLHRTKTLGGQAWFHLLYTPSVSGMDPAQGRDNGSNQKVLEYVENLIRQLEEMKKELNTYVGFTCKFKLLANASRLETTHEIDIPFNNYDCENHNIGMLEPSAMVRIYLSTSGVTDVGELEILEHSFY